MRNNIISPINSLQAESYNAITLHYTHHIMKYELSMWGSVAQYHQHEATIQIQISVQTRAGHGSLHIIVRAEFRICCRPMQPIQTQREHTSLFACRCIYSCCKKNLVTIRLRIIIKLFGQELPICQTLKINYWDYSVDIANTLPKAVMDNS